MASDISCVELRELLRFILASGPPARFASRPEASSGGWWRLIDRACELGYAKVQEPEDGAGTYITITAAGLRFLGLPIEPEGLQRTTNTLMGIWNDPASGSVKPRQRH